MHMATTTGAFGWCVRHACLCTSVDTISRPSAEQNSLTGIRACRCAAYWPNAACVSILTASAGQVATFSARTTMDCLALARRTALHGAGSKVRLLNCV